MTVYGAVALAELEGPVVALALLDELDSTATSTSTQPVPISCVASAAPTEVAPPTPAHFR